MPTQIVVGGSRANVEKAMALAKERGAQRALELNVSGAFHSRLMRPAVEGLTKAVQGVPVTDAAVPFVSNVTARPMLTAAEVRAELPKQIVSPVRWHQSIATMSAAGVSTFVEFGPGRVLTGMIRRLAPGAALVNVSTYAEAAQTRV
ncbi:MAG TPA: ACP S-malonyltransferase, partial [Dehalococcoidia bacterium]